MQTSTRSAGRWLRLTGLFLLSMMVVPWAARAQTTLIDPLGAGGFESGASFTANGWSTTVSGSNNNWNLGTAAAGFSGARAAYISVDGGTSFLADNSGGVVHFYRNIAFPALESKITLTFRLHVSNPDPGFDRVRVWSMPAANTPSAGTAIAASVDNIQHGLTNYENGTGGTFVTQATVSLPTSFAGTSRKIIFEYINDAFAPPAAIGIDDITLVSNLPANISSTAIGGLWSSPATWVGGVVPNADNVTIANGATVTVDQITSVNNLTINGNLNWNGTANAMTTSGNVLIGATGRLNLHTIAATPAQVNITCAGDFTNNGFANMSVSGLIMNRASGTQSIAGTGTFLGDPSGRGIIKVLQFATLATVTISTTQTLVTQFPAHTGGVLNTGNKLEIDNTAIPGGALFNEGVYTIAVTNMGSGYNTATPPTVTIAAPPAGTQATATPNIDDVTGTLRSITIVTNGDGYRATAPTVTIAGGSGTGATALACVWSPTANWGIANSTLQKSAVATISGTMPINSSQGVGSVFAATPGTGYTSAPTVGFSLPTGVWDLVTAQGSGYTAAVTVVFTGGGGTGAAGTATVANGRVTRIQITSGGSNYTSLPTISFTGGGGGTGAAAAFPPGCLATATASINANGMVTGFTITNAGSGYLPAAAPAVTLTGGGFTVAASGLTARVGAYNLVYGFFAPAATNATGTEGPEIPSNRRINALTMNSTAGNTFTGNLTLYAAAPATFTAGPWYFGGNTLTFENPTYAGATPTGTNGIASGNITMNSLGGSVTRTFPFNPAFAMVMGTGTLAAGSDITRLTVSRTGAPSGAVVPAATPTGLRTYTVNVASGTAFGTNPTTTLNWNAGDNLAGNQPGLVVIQSTTGITGGWNARTTGSGLGSIPATGSRTTATVAPGPIVFGSNMYFGYATTTALPPALAYNVTRSTGIAYSSIFGSGNNYTFGTVSTDDALSNAVDLTTIPGGPTTFTYQGSVLTAVKASTNGFLALNGAETASSFTNNFTALAGTAIAPFWDDLVVVPDNDLAASLNAAMQWQVIGAVPGSRQIVFEWRNMSFFGAAGPNMAFQIILNETGNTIQINYGLFQGFNGTNNHRPTYTVGLRGSFTSANPQPGEVFAQEYENFNLFSNAFTAGNNQGSNGLLNYPECNSRLSFTPGAYVPPAAPSITPPANDNSAGALPLAALLSFPTNLCGYYYSSRGATASPQAVCSGNANDDVWFKFTPDPDPLNPPFAFQYVVKLYASGGYTPTFEVLDQFLNPLGTPVCVVGSAGGSPQATITGLTPGLEYFIRVYHNEGPSSTTALLSAVVSGGSVVSSFVTGGVFGAGYSSTTSGSFNGSRARITGGGGQGASIGLNYAGGGISTFTIGSGGYGYTSTPTITVESPAWGPMGDFGIVVFQYLTPQPNNLPAAVTTLTVQTGSCSSSLTGQYTVNALDIPGPVLANTCACAGNGNPDDDLWYRFLATSNNATVQMQGVNNFSPVFQVYTGTANILDVDPTVFTHLTCSNNPGLNGLATASFSTVAGTYYWVRAYSPITGNTDPLATFDICVFALPPFAYTYSQTTGTYTDITGGTVVTLGNTDDAMYHSAGESGFADTQIGFNIGFPFTYQGLPYNQFVINTNGWIKLGNAAIDFGTVTGYNVMSGTEPNVIAGYNGDLDGDNGTSEMRFQTVGVSPNRELVVQFKDWKAFGLAPTTELLINFQIRLRESDGAVNIVYGPSTLQANATRFIGIKGAGASTGAFNVNARTTGISVATLVTGDLSKTTFQDGAGGGNVISAASNPLGLNNISQTFTPNPCSADIPVTAAPTLTAYNNVDLNWAAANGEVNGYDVRYRKGSDGIAGYTNASVGTGILTLNVTTLEPSTVYIFEVRTRCSVTDKSEWSIARSFTTPAAPNDVQVSALVAPLANGLTCFSNAMTVTVTVRNVGSNTRLAGENIPLNVTVTGPIPAVLNETLTLAANLAQNATVNYTFTGTVDMTSAGTYTFNAETNLPTDDATINDALTPAVTIDGYAPFVPAPTYAQGLNGVATGLAVQTVSGTQGWSLTTGATALRTSAPLANLSPQEGAGYGIYNSIAAGTSTGRLITPCFTVPTCYEVAFRHSRWDAQNNAAGTAVRVSTNGGTTWSAPLDIYNVTESKDEGTSVLQYRASTPAPIWQEFTVNLGAFAGQTVRVAFEASNPAGGITRFGVDNIVVREQILDDVAAQALVAPVSNSTCGIPAAAVIIRVRNFGCNPQSNIPISVTVAGPTPASLSGTVPGPIAGNGGFVDFNIGTINTVASGTYTISASTALPGDQRLSNDNLPGVPVVFKQNPTISNTIVPQNVVFGSGANASVSGTASVSIPLSVFSNATPVAVPDGINNKGDRGPVATSSIVVSTLPGATLANAINAITINATHGFSTDFDFEIQAPNGTIYNLHTNTSTGGGANITGMRFVASGAPSVTTGTPPYNGNWLPQTPFSSFTGPANGTWTLRVYDNWSFLTGTLDNWSMEFGSVLTNVTWTCPTCPVAPVAFPLVNNTPPATVPSVGAIGATYPIGVYPITLQATDDQGCFSEEEEVMTVFTTNSWLGLIDGPDSYNNPANWQSAPAPPTSLVAVEIKPGTPFQPKLSGTGNSGNFTLFTGATLEFTAGTGRLNVANAFVGDNVSITGPGRVVMSGTTAQTIGGNTQFENLEINKTAGVVNVTGTARVNGVLTMGSATSSLNVSTGNLILTSNASNTAKIAPVPAGATISGNVTMQRFLPWTGPGDQGGWFFLGSPISGKNFTDYSDDFKVYGPASAYGSQGGGIYAVGVQHTTIFEYLQANHNITQDTAQKIGWTAPSGNIQNGKGYRVFISRPSMGGIPTMDNVGTVLTGNFNFPTLTRNEYANCQPDVSPATVACTEGNRGWNLIGNPYPCAVDWDGAGWTKPASMNNAIYTWNKAAGSYQVYLGTTGTPGVSLGGSSISSLSTPPNVIPSSQGFFVKLRNPGTYTATLQSTEAVKTLVTSGSFVRTATANNQVRIRMQHNSNTDYRFDGMIRFDEAASYNFDMNKDVDALSGQSFDFHMLADNGEGLLMNTVPVPAESKVMPMVVDYKGQVGTFRFSFLEQESLTNGVQMYLKDNFLGTLTSVVSNPVYAFTVNSADGSNASDRFEIVISPSSVTGINRVLDGVGFGIYPNPVEGASNFTVALRSDIDGGAQVSITDVLGKVVFTNEMVAKAGELSEKVLQPKLAAGVYTVKVISNGKTFTEKLVVR